MLALYRILLVVTVTFLAGCSNLQDARNSRGTGLARVYDADSEQVWKVMPEVLRGLSLSYAGDNRQEGYVLAQHGVSMFSYGEEVAIFIAPTPGAPPRTRVEVVSKRRVSGNIFAPDWAVRILDRLGERLK